MNVKMIDRLPAVITRIDDQSISRLIDSKFLRQVFGGGCHLVEKSPILLGQIADFRDMLFRNNQKVNRRLRIDILERDDVVVFILKRRWNFSFYNLTKDTVPGVMFGHDVPFLFLIVDGENRPCCIESREIMIHFVKKNSDRQHDCAIFPWMTPRFPSINTLNEFYERSS